jgi:hypothetical protein
MKKDSKKPSLTLVGPTTTGNAPPRKLGEHGLSLWNAVHSEYRIDDRGGIKILTQICAASDRIEALAAQINEDGETIRTQNGRPEIASVPKGVVARCSLGVNQGSPPECMDQFQRKDWRNAQALQRELLKVAGWPDCRAAYQENLREAEEWEEYCQELVDHPDRGQSGTGSDPASRRRKLGETKAAVADRRRLLAELDETAEA